MPVINTGTNPKMLWPGLNDIFGATYNEHVKEYTDLVDVLKSRKNYEEDLQIDRFGLAVIKPQGEGVSFDAENQGYVSRYVHTVYGLGYIVTREEMEDNLYMEKAGPRTKSLAFSMHQTKENVVANVYNRAFNSSHIGGDGVSLINTSHPTANGTQSNRLTVDADFSQAALEDILNQITLATDGRGLKIPIDALTLIAHPNNRWEVRRVLGSPLQSNTAENALNVVKGTVEPKFNRYFDDTNAWFIRTNCPSGLKLYQRRPLEFTQDNDWHTENHLYKATERYSVRWSDWRALYGSAGAS